MTISVADRRAVGERAADDAAFRSLLMRDPRAAVEQAVGHPVSDDRRIDVVSEGDEWDFILVEPEAIAAGLPDPVDVRTAAENQAYTLLGQEPALRDEAERDPERFARERLGVFLDGSPLVIHRDSATSLKILIPNRGAREQLSDDMLDLASAGSTCPATAAIS